MNEIAVTFAKLAGLHKTVSSRIEEPRARYFDPAQVLEYFEAYNRHVNRLKQLLPDLFGDVPDRLMPVSSGTTDNEGRGYGRDATGTARWGSGACLAGYHRRHYDSGGDAR